MDFLKKAAEGIKGSGDKKEGDQAAAQQGGEQQDYGDKAFAAGLKQTGFGDKVNREQQEKITDGARSAYEKATGSKVDAKYSN